MKYTNKYSQPTRVQMWYDNEVPAFTCERCGEKLSAEFTGFVDRDGLPVHTKCGQAGEWVEYKNANGGKGYKLHLPGWDEFVFSEHFKRSAANRALKRLQRKVKCVWIEDTGKKILVVGGTL